MRFERMGLPKPARAGATRLPSLTHARRQPGSGDGPEQVLFHARVFNPTFVPGKFSFLRGSIAQVGNYAYILERTNKKIDLTDEGKTLKNVLPLFKNDSGHAPLCGRGMRDLSCRNKFRMIEILNALIRKQSFFSRRCNADRQPTNSEPTVPK